MNIYLDIDGVLLVNESQAANHADEFLTVVLTNYPDSTHWLTTHCWKGENRAKDIISSHLTPETVALLHKIKPTGWGEMKTDAIDFEEPFLWFDDDLWPEEQKSLRDHAAEHQFVMVDLAKDPDMLRKLIPLFNEL